MLSFDRVLAAFREEPTAPLAAFLHSRLGASRGFAKVLTAQDLEALRRFERQPQRDQALAAQLADSMRSVH